MATKSSKANMGKILEDKIIKINKHYLEVGTASIKKVPNAWVVRRKGPHIIGANPVPSGLCDFVGTSHLVGGRQIVFDAKECKLKTRFPLRNIKPSQMDHMKETVDHGGIAFLIIWFTETDEMFYVPYQFIEAYWIDAELHPDDKNKSIPLQDIQNHCTVITEMEYMGHVRFYNETYDY
jgi:recombination protein U